MQGRYNLAHFIFAGVVALGLTTLMVVVDAQAQIAFVSDRDGNPEIYVMDADGGNQQRLTENRHDDWDPSWSPDGKRIAFVSKRDKKVKNFVPTFEIYVMDADGGNQQRLTENRQNDLSLSWSPNSERIAFAVDGKGNFENFEIYVMDADGGNQQRLTENRQNDLSLSWSPNSERIAFAADGKGNFENFEIYVMDADGGNQQRLTENPAYDWNPSWSPDGERIAFMSKRDGNPEIYVMDADGGNPQNLTNNPHSDASPVWFVPAFLVAPAGKP